jgi:hypothetical protein
MVKKLLALTSWFLAADVFGQEISAISIMKDINRQLQVPGTTSQLHMKVIEGSRTVREKRLARYTGQFSDGTEKTLLEVLYPPEEKGVKLLLEETESRKVLYSYLPAFRQVRTLPASADKDEFLRSDFWHIDLRPSENLVDYDFKIARQEGTLFVIEAASKNPPKTVYTKKIIWVEKKGAAFTEVKTEFYRPEGLAKIQENSGLIEIAAGNWRPTRVVMRNLVKNRHTVIDISGWKIEDRINSRKVSKSNLGEF